jgi:hypothetical protein
MLREKLHSLALFLLVTLLFWVMLVPANAFIAGSESSALRGPAVERLVAQAVTGTSVPLSLGPSTTNVTIPCWAVNASICVAINMTQSGSNDVVPTPPILNSSFAQDPQPTTTLHFDVYSVYDLQAAWGYGAGSNKLTGADAYLYINVTDVLWNGIAWFCDCDNSVWHANAGYNWAPSGFSHINETVKDMVYTKTSAPPQDHCSTSPSTGMDACTIFAKYLYPLNISGESESANGELTPNFPSGSYVQWSVTSVHMVTSGNTTYGAINSTTKIFGNTFSYYVKGAWYWSTAGSTTGCAPGQAVQLCYPNAPSTTNCPTSGLSFSAAAFKCNLLVTENPSGEPTIGGNVIVTLETNSRWQNLTGAEMLRATLSLQEYFPSGVYWRSWETGFTPLTGSYPATTVRAEIPPSLFTNASEKVEWEITAYDMNGYSMTSTNYTDLVSSQGIFPSSNFSLDCNLTTNPAKIGTELPNGTLPSTGEYPTVELAQVVKVTITSVMPNVTIASAMIYLRIDFAPVGAGSTGYNQTAVESLKKVTLTQYYYNIQPLNPGTNVSFFVRAWDFNDNEVTSRTYYYYVPAVPLPESLGQGFFYVEVYDNSTQHYVTGANVTIYGEDGAIRIITKTNAGLAYPNLTGNSTPAFLPANTTYSLVVSWGGFSVSGEPAGTDSLRTSFYLTHRMNSTATLLKGGNYIVQEKGDIIYFALNVPAPPPTFSNSNPAWFAYVTGGVGLLAVTAIFVPVYMMWMDMKKKAEAEEKRITL